MDNTFSENKVTKQLSRLDGQLKKHSDAQKVLELAKRIENSYINEEIYDVARRCIIIRKVRLKKEHHD